MLASQVRHLFTAFEKQQQPAAVPSTKTATTVREEKLAGNSPRRKRKDRKVEAKAKIKAEIDEEEKMKIQEAIAAVRRAALPPAYCPDCQTPLPASRVLTPGDCGCSGEQVFFLDVNTNKMTLGSRLLNLPNANSQNEPLRTECNM